MAKKKGGNLVSFGTVKIISTTKAMIKDCERADHHLSEVLKYLIDDTLLTAKQKDSVRENAVKLREALLFSIKMSKEVIKLWENSLSK